VNSGEKITDIDIFVPEVSSFDPVYLIATLIKNNDIWENRLAEDRTYDIQLV
jgi:hypothetical protein